VQSKIAVVGQGYVGLPLALAAAKAGFSVIGLDNNSDKVLNLKNFVSGVEGVTSDDLKEITSKGNYFATTEFSMLVEAKTILICVPTPLGESGKPDLKYLIEATTNVAINMSRDTLVIVESTVAPGTIRNTIGPLIKNESKFGDQDFTLAFSPERIDPLNDTWSIENTPKLLSALSEDGYRLAFDFYSKFVNTVIKCDSVEIAETAKLLENSFRLVNISVINEIAVFCQKFGIEVNDVIQAASTKPYGFMPFYPGLGVGGHCIPVDPVYLSEKAKELDVPMRMIDAAQQINKKRPQYFVEQSIKKIGDLTEKRILVLGLAYKPNVSDIRETPTEPLIKGLRERGAIVAWHDDLVGEWNGEKSVDLSTNYDLAILATPHNYFDLSKLGNVPILNTRGSL